MRSWLLVDAQKMTVPSSTWVLTPMSCNLLFPTVGATLGTTVALQSDSSFHVQFRCLVVTDRTIQSHQMQSQLQKREGSGIVTADRKMLPEHLHANSMARPSTVAGSRTPRLVGFSSIIFWERSNSVLWLSVALLNPLSS